MWLQTIKYGLCGWRGKTKEENLPHERQSDFIPVGRVVKRLRQRLHYAGEIWKISFDVPSIPNLSRKRTRFFSAVWPTGPHLIRHENAALFLRFGLPVHTLSVTKTQLYFCGLAYRSTPYPSRKRSFISAVWRIGPHLIRHENAALFLRFGLPVHTLSVIKTKHWVNALQTGEVWKRQLFVLPWM